MNDDDGMCMLYSAEATRIHLTLGKPGAMTHKQFAKLLAYGSKQRTDARRPKFTTLREHVEALLDDCPEMERNLPSYSVEKHAPILQGMRHMICIFFGIPLSLLQSQVSGEVSTCVFQSVW